MNRQGPTHTSRDSGTAVQNEGPPGDANGALDYDRCPGCGTWSLLGEGRYCTQCGARRGGRQATGTRRTLPASRGQRPAAGRLPAPVLTQHIHRGAARAWVRPRGGALQPWSSGGRIIVWGAAGLFSVLMLIQLIHLAQVAVTLVSLLVVLRLLGLVGGR